jgi:hypothetical protein
MAFGGSKVYRVKQEACLVWPQSSLPACSLVIAACCLLSQLPVEAYYVVEGMGDLISSVVAVQQLQLPTAAACCLCCSFRVGGHGLGGDGSGWLA